MTRKHPLLCLVLLFTALTTGWANDDLPKREPFARYEPMLKRSPFAVATAAAPVGTTPDFARDLYVANAAHSAIGDFVTIASTTDTNFKEYLTTKEPVDGFSIPHIQWSDRVGETKVTVAKDGQVATLTFNEALLTQAIHNAIPQVPQPQQQGVAGRQPYNLPMQLPRPMAVPTIPTPPPRTRPIIRRQEQPEINRPQPPSDDDDDSNQ